MSIMKCAKFILCTVLAGSLAHGAFAKDDSTASAADWLQRMNTAFSELDYDGVFSFISGSDITSLRIIHMYENGVQSERLVHLDGAPREIVREGNKVLCILRPEDELIALSSSIPSGPFAQAFVRNFDDVGRNYHLEMGGEDRMAGRATVRMVVKPKDEHRYGYRLWLDKETGLLLRSDLVDEITDKSLEVFQFSHLVTGAGVQRTALKSEQPNGAVIDHFEVADESSTKPGSGVDEWHATWLPQGFEMAAIDIRRVAANTEEMNTLMYTDGLAAISVFIEETHDDEEMGKMVARHGATVSVTEVVKGPKGSEHVITVVGEIPQQTASSIAASVRFGN